MSLLDDILAATRARIELARQTVREDALEARIASLSAARPFRDALDTGTVSVIAEIKRASPLHGPLAPDLDAGRLAGLYAEGGAAAISVLTEPEFFKGSLEDLEAARTGGLPLLRKDFVVDEYQLLEARAAGADAVLLIVRAIGDELARLHAGARALGLDALVEVHDAGEMEAAAATGAALIGINHRDLATFEVDPDRTAKLAPQAPEGAFLVALSGVRTRAEVESLAAAGARSVLVGESLVTAADPVAQLRALRGVA